MASPSPNLTFSKLSSSVSLYSPLNTTKSPTNTDPTLIIICQWMGVSPRSRALNAAYHKYASLYPSTRILTLRSPPEVFISTSTATRLASFKPIISAIDVDTSPRILVHAFSNGGTLSYTDICTVYKRATGKVLPVKALVLDSAPGLPTLQEAWAAMSIGLPKGIMWYPAAVFVATGLGLTAFARSVLGWESVVHKTYELLNNWDVVDKNAKRLYVYSVKDALVGCKDVERHAEMAGKAGVVVERLREEETGHVQHMIGDTETYWESLEKFWRSAAEA